MSKDKIKVLIVDDSSLTRDMLQELLNADPEIEVVATAENGLQGVESALSLKPDVITMDIKMPIMDGFEAINQIMQKYPIPIIVISSRDMSVVKKVLEVGAMDFIILDKDIESISLDIVDKVKTASKVKPLRRIKLKKKTKAVKSRAGRKKNSLYKVIVIGVSTGGPQALQILLSKFSGSIKASIIIVQHIAEGFVEGLAQWLDESVDLKVKVAVENDYLDAGSVIIAPTGKHLIIDDDSRVRLVDSKESNAAHVPSIDVAMKSIAGVFKETAIGVIMTGMGRDGVEGMEEIKSKGGFTIAQDEDSSVIFGMNKLAIEKCCIDAVVPLEDIADKITELVEGDSNG